jgi:hypothetical protein
MDNMKLLEPSELLLQEWQERDQHEVDRSIDQLKSLPYFCDENGNFLSLEKDYVSYRAYTAGNYRVIKIGRLISIIQKVCSARGVPVARPKLELETNRRLRPWG